MSGEARRDVDLVGHRVIELDPRKGGHPPFQNVIIKNPDPNHKWLEPASRAIGEWRARLRSTYIRWAITINGLEVAAARYGDPGWPAGKGFMVTSLRPTGGKDDQGRTGVDTTPIAVWDGPTAAAAHESVMPEIAAFGLIDLYTKLEEFVFDLYRIYLNHHPEAILEGPEHQDLRRLRRGASEGPDKQAAWDAAWTARLDAWQRKKLYQGLGKVFRSFCSHSGLKTPPVYKVSTVETWAETIDIIGLVRHALVHGVRTVTDDIAEASTKPHAMLFDFKKGAPLVVGLPHLQGVEFYCDQLLTGLNLAMFESVRPPKI